MTVNFALKASVLATVQLVRKQFNDKKLITLNCIIFRKMKTTIKFNRKFRFSVKNYVQTNCF